MTKRTMVKKFRKETGADKKTAMDYLRKNGWNYGNAVSLYRLSDLLNDWTKKFAKMVESFGSKNKESDLE